ncbi:MAG: T9SS type A sorting domain-containing protein [Candidatus Marinimicrobia bacterium]|nr:T9SS type A sorting domain-containing protein [Candidatus Neomarinimicrobiota bacterium]
MIPDAVSLRLTDSLYTVWTEEENEYYYHYGDTLYYASDTLEDGTYIPFLMSPGWILFYTAEMRTDAEGGLHIVFPMLRNICMDYNGGCDDGDGDGFADSAYINLSMGGQGIIHIYSPDPMSGEDNWTASFLHDMALDYEADWFASDIATLFHDGDGSDYLGTMQYFYPNITMSAESEETMWFAISGMSDYEIEYDADSSETYIPTDIDIWMAKSTDNGHHWSEVENVTNTPTTGELVPTTPTTGGGYPSEAALESGIHLANQGMDESVGVFYQMMDPNVNTIDDNDGYEDYKNWVYVGVYGIHWEDVAIGKENIPSAFTLKQNYPNPFNPITQIQYEMKSAGQVNMELFDIRGAKVRTLINEQKPAGSYEFTFDGLQLSSGIYFYSMTANGFTKTRKLVLMK